MIPDVTYRQDLSGLQEVMKSGEMQRFMAGVGRDGAAQAKRYSTTPREITSATVMSYDRWGVVVTNEARDARWQEYGSPNARPPLPPRAPLANGVLIPLWMADPNRRQGFTRRLRQ